MKATVFFLLFLGLVLWSSCRTDFESVESTGNLQFSKDTVFLDTVFSNLSTSTYSLKVYNRTNEDVVVPTIRLSLGEDSGYRLNVDGISGKSFENIEILAKDSIYIFVETTVDFQELKTSENQFLYTDAIEFISEAHLQKIPLITLIKDAVFLYPKKDSNGNVETLPWGMDDNGQETEVSGFFLEEENLRFTKNTPYVIYGYAAVPSGKVLEIEAGTRIYFHANSGIIVPEMASIQVNGKPSADKNLLEKEVVFEGDRLESGFKNIPGQWGTIWLKEGSINNRFNHTTIKNATISLLVDGNQEETTSALFLENTQIYNSASNGILARNASVQAENLVINNSGQASVHLSDGGKYNFLHVTFTNYWRNGYRSYPAVYISNTSEVATENQYLYVHFSNSIIYGNQSRELLINLQEDSKFNISFENCLIKSGNPESGIANFENVIFNEDPLFLDPRENNLQLDSISPARDIGNPATALRVPFDILNSTRTNEPDLGAYEWNSSEGKSRGRKLVL